MLLLEWKPKREAGRAQVTSGGSKVSGVFWWQLNHRKSRCINTARQYLGNNDNEHNVDQRQVEMPRNVIESLMTFAGRYPFTPFFSHNIIWVPHSWSGNIRSRKGMTWDFIIPSETFKSLPSALFWISKTYLKVVVDFLLTFTGLSPDYSWPN